MGTLRLSVVFFDEVCERNQISPYELNPYELKVNYLHIYLSRISSNFNSNNKL